MNISYIKQGDYLLPDLILKEKVQYNIGKYGLLRLQYIKKYKLGLYFDLLVNDNLNEYLHDIDTTVMEKVQSLIKELDEKENINEKLKQDNQILWVSKMNNIKNIAEEIILKEYIYVWKTLEEFERIYLPVCINYDNYLKEFVIQDVVAFYIADNFYKKVLSKAPLYNHINSAIDIFNVRCEIDKLIPSIKKILRIKYNLIIVKDNPLILKKFY